MKFSKKISLSLAMLIIIVGNICTVYASSIDTPKIITSTTALSETIKANAFTDNSKKYNQLIIGGKGEISYNPLSTESIKYDSKYYQVLLFSSYKKDCPAFDPAIIGGSVFLWNKDRWKLISVQPLIMKLGQYCQINKPKTVALGLGHVGFLFVNKGWSTGVYSKSAVLVAFSTSFQRNHQIRVAWADKGISGACKGESCKMQGTSHYAFHGKISFVKVLGKSWYNVHIKRIGTCPDWKNAKFDKVTKSISVNIVHCPSSVTVSLPVLKYLKENAFSPQFPWG
ncbi:MULTISPECIES: hypothetical protein [Acidithiobacillus]|uniref:hypothetical protein n=1 Tax=Acidithiobacillus TaxID=119977 RepID=UPI00094B5177|nr:MULTISPECIES: hypothetical protein [Acidithiobacillus]MDD5279751.1 hypothetical protein [Acidithiobacillus sp.]